MKIIVLLTMLFASIECLAELTHPIAVKWGAEDTLNHLAQLTLPTEIVVEIPAGDTAHVYKISLEPSNKIVLMRITIKNKR